MGFRKGQVVLQECNRRNPLSRLIAASEGAVVTHAWLVTHRNTGVEATWPRVRELDIADRVRELRDNDQAFAVLDLKIGRVARSRIAAKAETYLGRWYDIGQILLYALTHRFWNDGTGTLLCSRLITAAFREGADTDLFPEAILNEHFANSPKLANLRQGYATPADLLKSRLTVIAFSPSSRIRCVEDLCSTVE